jgi:glutamine amidotransferase
VNVALFDYGAGNLHSLAKALEGAGACVHVTSDWGEALGLDGLVLPGVGAFGAAAAALPVDPAPVRRALAEGLPCLGICLGMQLLFDRSEEAAGAGIGWLPGRVVRLRASVVPQMGWNDVEATDQAVFGDARGFVGYYANSFVCEPDDPADAIAWSVCEDTRFVAAVRRGRTWGVQFHPEKSSAPGRALVARWVAMAGGAG